MDPYEIKKDNGMIKHIDLFLPPNVSQYGVLHHFTHKFHEALQRLGVKSRILEAERNNPKPFLTELFKDVPDCTLSFNGLLPDEEGRFFCDLIRIPHVACTVDSPNSFFSLADSPFTIITNVDKYGCEFFKGINAQNVFFMPHGVEKNLALPADDHRPYDVLMLSSCIDYEHIRKQWASKYPQALVKVMDDAAELALSDRKIPYVQAFVQSLDKHISSGAAIDPNQIEFIDVLDELESYIRGKDRVELVKGIKDAKVDIFGSAAPTTTWKKQLGDQKNIVIHDPVPYDQALELMQKSKIVANSCAWITNGTHERTLAGLAAGSAVITAENIFMKENFKDGTSISFYHPGKWGQINSVINNLLSDETKRKKIAAAGRKEVLDKHTWDHRARVLLQELTPILQKLKGE
jgi:spore maturation protein CgeB